MNCVRHVREALEEIKGITEVNVDLKGKNAVIVSNDDVTDSQLKAAIEDAGYDVVGIENL